MMMKEEVKMRKGMLIGFTLLLVMPGLLLTVSCGKKQVLPDETMVTGQEDTDAARRAEEERLAEERRRKEEAIKEEALKKERMAREAFENEDIYFHYDDAELTSDAQKLLKEKAQWMKDNPGIRAIIEGHCDERGSNEYNLALGDRRAEKAKTYLIILGISASRLTTVSYGEERPVDTGKTESAYAKNRRAHFVLK
jgi:peptidoglycan-associated lipoprotein